MAYTPTPAERIKVWLKKRTLSYEWMSRMLYSWLGVVATATNIRVSVCNDVNPELLKNVITVMNRYDERMHINED